MAWLLEALLFLLPLLGYLFWRRANPGVEPGLRLVLAAAAGVVLVLGSLLWFGLSRSLDAGVYVPPHVQDGVVVPGHTEPVRPSPARPSPTPASPAPASPAPPSPNSPSPAPR